jgi:hypothetical protein
MLKRKKIRTPDAILVAILLLTFIIYLLLSIKKDPPKPLYDFGKVFNELNIRKIDKAKLRASIRIAAEYLMNNIDDDGKFVYKRNKDSTVEVNHKYNTLRHAGSVYALCRFYEYSNDKRALEAAVRTAFYLKRNMLAPIKMHDNLMGVWSRPQINNDGSTDVVKLGGNGLGLLALSNVEKLKAGFISADTLDMIADFLLFMQKPNGGFYSKYYPGKKQRDDSWTSLYYPGEAALGLLSLYELNSKPKYLNAAADALAYLAKKRKGKLRVEADHWALIASSALFAKDENIKASKKNIRAHGIQLSKSILLENPQNISSSPYFGSLSSDGRVTPTATRMEGLLAALQFIPHERESLIYSIVLTINKGVGFLMNSQIREGELKGGIPRQRIVTDSLAMSYGVKPDLNRMGEVRIDYVQHALCAMIQYDELFNK